MNFIRSDQSPNPGCLSRVNMSSVFLRSDPGLLLKFATLCRVADPGEIPSDPGLTLEKRPDTDPSYENSLNKIV